MAAILGVPSWLIYEVTYILQLKHHSALGSIAKQMCNVEIISYTRIAGHYTQEL